VGNVLAIMAGADAVDEAPRGLVRRERLVGESPHRAQQLAVRQLDLAQEVVGRDVLPGLDEACVPAVEVVVGPLGVGRLAPRHALERRQHLPVPAGDVGDDLAHPPRPQPHLAHLGLAESVDGGSQLRVFLLGRLDDIVLRFHRAPPVVGFAPLLPGHRWASPVKHVIERLALNGLMPLERG